MTPQMFASVQAILASAMMPHPFDPPYPVEINRHSFSFTWLHETIIAEDLRNEWLYVHRILSSPDTFEDTLKRAIQAREQRHPNTFLSILNNPELPVNLFYLDLIIAVFNPPNLDAFIRLLFPAVKHQLTYDLDDHLLGVAHSADLHRLKPSLDNIRMSLRRVEQFLSMEHQIAGDALDQGDLKRQFIARIKHCVIQGNLICDLSEIGSLPLVLHLKWYEQLKQHYPAMCQKVYSHNDALQKLQSNLIRISKGQQHTPMVKLTELTQQLREKGAVTTGFVYAGDSVDDILEDFTHYIISLPDALRASLFELKVRAGDKTFAGIWKDLAACDCIQTASYNIQLILENGANQAVLMQVPPDREDSEKGFNLRKKYLLNTVCANSTHMPEDWVRSILPTFKVNTIHEMMWVVFNFPPAFYSMLFRYIDVDFHSEFSNQLAQLIRENQAFHPIALDALKTAIVKNLPVFGRPANMLEFAIASQSHDLIVRVFLSQESMIRVALAMLPSQVSKVNFLNHIARFDIYCTIAIIEGLTSTELEEIVRKTAHFPNQSILYSLCMYPQIIETIIRRLEPQLALRFLKNTTTGNRQPLLHFAAINNYDETIQRILNCFPEVDRMMLIEQENLNQENLLSLVRSHKTVLGIILHTLSVPNRIHILTKPHSRSGEIYLRMLAEWGRHADMVESFLMVLSLIPIEHRLTVLSAKDSLGASVLHASTRHPLLLQEIFKLLSPADCYTALAVTNGGDISVEASIHNKKSLAFIYKLAGKAPLDKRKNQARHSKEGGEGESAEAGYGRLFQSKRARDDKDENDHDHDEAPKHDSGAM